jgi:regulation of enolase protein 1 (concanavalin A-like superfamily)
MHRGSLFGFDADEREALRRRASNVVVVRVRIDVSFNTFNDEATVIDLLLNQK